MGEDEAAGPAPVNSIWWYAIGFSAVWGLVAWLVFLFYVGTAGADGGPSTELLVLSVAVLAVDPVAIWLDVGAIERSGVDWNPNARLWIAVAVLGIPATLFTSFVAGAYLFYRHRHVGLP